MARKRKWLDALGVQRASKPGLHPVGPGLYLKVRHSVPDEAGMIHVTRAWVLRFMARGKRHDMGLGPFPLITLADARRRAEDARRMLVDGVNPLHARRAKLAALSAVPTFREAADRYIAAHRSGWKNAKHAGQWQATLEAYAFPTIGQLSVADIQVAHVVKVLEPIWTTRWETAKRLRGRIEAVIDASIAVGERATANPATWKGRLDTLLGARPKTARVEHHAALDWRLIGAFMQELRARPAPAARALEFLVLTAARGGEVRGARWAEIDLAGGVWTVPGARMKAGRDHRVPLPEDALAVLKSALASHVEITGKLPAPDALVFEGGRRGRPLSENAFMALLERMGRADVTSHGFRSTFRQWCAEATNFPREVAEAALAHTNRDKVESAYQRGDHFDQRRRLMTDWARFCSQPLTAEGGNVVALRAAP